MKPMSENTKIEWCDHSWSPWRGCTKVSPGCANCYADALATRFGPTWGNWGKGKPRVLAKNWGNPVKWNVALHRPLCSECNSGMIANGVCCVDRLPRITKTVFPSLCDWLDEEVSPEWLADFLQLIQRTPNLTWLLLTKRPRNFHSQLQSAWRRMASKPKFTSLEAMRVRDWVDEGKPPANVWIGASVEDQIRADERIPALLSIPAAGRFLSAEPLLGPVNLYNSGAIRIAKDDPTGRCRDIDWVIIGGESGPGSRPCNVDWIRSLVVQCKGAGVPVFVKQLGARPCSESACGATWRHVVTHKKGGDPAEWPEHLRVRQFPSFGGAR